ncbi:MAG: hypothetical protein ACMUIM_07060 [bacterium]
MKKVMVLLTVSFFLLWSASFSLAKRASSPDGDSKTRKTIVVGADEDWMDKFIEAEKGKDASKIIIIPEEPEEKTDYFIEDLKIKGDMAAGQLSLTGEGHVMRGQEAKVYLFSSNQDILIRDLQVNGARAIGAFDKQGYYFISTRRAFSFKGTLQIKDKSQIKFKTIGPVNRLVFDLTHGYAVDGDQFGIVDRDIILQRIYEKTRPALVRGSFRYSLADVNTFLYQISFQSYGDVIGSYTLELPNGEQVFDVEGALRWEQRGSRLILDLTAASTRVAIKGTFQLVDEIRIPLRKGLHYVVIGSEPEKKLTLETGAQEKDLSEADMEVLYSNSRAFLASFHDRFKLKIQPLELIPSLAATSRSTQVTYALNDQGSILYEMNCQYQNTGVDYLEVDVTGTPLYAAMQGRPVKLTREEKLFLSFPKSGHGNFDLVSFVTRRALGWISFVRLPFPKIDVPITTRTTKVFYPADYLSLTVFGARGGSEMPEAKNIILFLVLVSFLGALLVKERRFVFWFLILAIGAFYFDVRLFILLIILSLTLIIRAYAGKVKFKKLFLVVAAVIVLALTVLLSLWIMKGFRLKQPYYAAQRLADKTIPMEDEALEQAPRFKGTTRIGEGTGAITVPTKQGVLPVKFELPSLGKSLSVTNHLVTREKPQSITMVLFAARFKYILYILMFIAAWMCYKIYMKRQFFRGMRS